MLEMNSYKNDNLHCSKYGPLVINYEESFDPSILFKHALFVAHYESFECSKNENIINDYDKDSLDEYLSGLNTKK